MDDKLFRALQSLPREHARPGFTDRVLHRIGDLENRPEVSVFAGRWRWPLVAVAAAAVCLVAFSTGAKDWWHQHQQRQGLARLASIDNERRALLVELESLQQQMTRARPRIYVGGTNDVDFVLDVDRLQRSDYKLTESSPRATRRFETELFGSMPTVRIPNGQTLTGRPSAGRNPTRRSLDVRLASFTPTRPTIY